MPDLRHNFSKRMKNYMVVPRPEKMMMGRPDGTVIVDAVNEPMMIWVTGHSGRPEKVLNREVPNNPGTVVMVGYNPFNLDKRKQVLCLADLYPEAGWMGPAVMTHADTHNFGGADCDFVLRERIVYVAPVPGQNKVDVYPGAKRLPTGLWWWGITATRADFAPYVPASGVIICAIVLTSAGALAYRTGTPEALRDDLDETNLPSLITGDSTLCILILTAGMTEAHHEKGNDDFIQIPEAGAPGGILDAPSDGTIYGRKNGTWETVIGDIRADLFGSDEILPSAYLPTPSGNIEIKDRCVRSVNNPIISPTVSWEETAIEEPTILVDDGYWKMWYTGGWNNPAIGYATCPLSSDPTVTSNWTKYAGNPVLGQGGSGVSGWVARPSVLKVDSTFWIMYSTNTAKWVATSPDGITWTVQTSSATLPAGKTYWGNSYVWVEDGQWYLLADAGPNIWELYLYTSPDGLNWTIANSGNALTSLQVYAGGMYGGPMMPTPQKIDGLYQLWYHANATSGVLPTEIYHATSKDLINWTVTTPNPILTHLGGTTYEFDQVADPDVHEYDGRTYLWYEGVNNITGVSEVAVAVFDGTLHELISGAGSVVRLNSSGQVPATQLPSFGDVYGPTSSIDGRLAIFDGTTGKLLRMGALPSTFAVVMETGVTFPPVPLTSEEGDDWIYST